MSKFSNAWKRAAARGPDYLLIRPKGTVDYLVVKVRDLDALKQSGAEVWGRERAA